MEPSSPCPLDSHITQGTAVLNTYMLNKQRKCFSSSSYAPVLQLKRLSRATPDQLDNFSRISYAVKQLLLAKCFPMCLQLMPYTYSNESYSPIIKSKLYDISMIDFG